MQSSKIQYVHVYVQDSLKRAGLFIHQMKMAKKGFRPEDRIRARICPGDSLKRAGLFIHQMQMAKKGPNGDQRLPWALVFWNGNPIRRGLRPAQSRNGDGSATGLDPIELFWSFDPWIIRTHWYQFWTAQHWLKPGSGRIYRLPPLPPTPSISVV